MSRALVILRSQAERDRVRKWAYDAPTGTRVEFKAAKRTLPQNDRMWAMLTDVAQQLDWHGMKLRPDDWKKVFMDAYGGELRMVPNLAGTGFVNLGYSSSDLSKEEMGELMELIAAEGAKRGVRFQDDDTGVAA